MAIKVNKNSKYWNGYQLLSKFPPLNHFAWRYGVEGRSEGDRETGRFFVANSEYPIVDPWRRPLLKWTDDGGKTENEWTPCPEPEHKGYYYRYVSVQKKLIKLFLPMPGATTC